jgi:protein-S-isoprenylcysteine O-methyltransferase Ste14
VTAEGKSKAAASYEVRFSLKVIRAERRRGLLSGLGLILLSCVPFIDASIAIGHHEMVNLGSAANTFFVPPWVAVLFGLLLVLAGCAVLYVSIKRRKS